MHVVHIDEIRALKKLSVRVLLVLFTKENPTESKSLSLEEIRRALIKVFRLDYAPERLNEAIEELAAKHLINKEEYPRIRAFYYSGTCPGCKMVKAVRAHQLEVPQFAALLAPGTDPDVG